MVIITWTFRCYRLLNTNIRHTQRVSSFERVSAVADKQFPDADTRGKSAEEPLRGITPPAFTQSGSEAYLARAHSGLQPDVEEDRRGIYVPGRRRI